jgi:uncharacterized OB-fold protein
MDFFEEILNSARKGKFVTSYCQQCNKYIWPPKDSCNLCYSTAVIKDVPSNGVLLSKSISYISGKEGYFGLGEFTGIRIIGTIERSMKIGDRIVICRIREKNRKIDLKFCDDM